MCLCFKELLASLEQAKSSAATIEASLKESGSLQKSLENERKAYLPLSEAAANLYFVISDLSKLNNMYRFSLNAFQNLFHKALQIPQVWVHGPFLLNLLKMYNCTSWLYTPFHLRFSSQTETCQSVIENI